MFARIQLEYNIRFWPQAAGVQICVGMTATDPKETIAVDIEL